MTKDHEGACCQRHTAESLSPENEFGLTINANVQRKNCKKMKKQKESEMKKAQSKKRVKMKIKKNEKKGLE